MLGVNFVFCFLCVCFHRNQCKLLTTLSQVKELGLLGMDCPSLAEDAQKLFDVYWYLSTPGAHIPDPWPPQYTADTSLTHPAAISINGTSALAYWAVSFLLNYISPSHSNTVGEGPYVVT